MDIELGSVISGTLRPQDLGPAFVETLREIDPESEILRETDGFDWGRDDAPEMLADLVDALNEYAPDGAYFGAHPGDGSDFGFWELEF